MKRLRRKPVDKGARIRTRAASEWSRVYPGIRENILELCKWMNFEPTSQQAEVLKLVQYESQLPYDKRLKRIAIKSGQGPGKCLRSSVYVFDALSGQRMTVKEMAQRGGQFAVPSMESPTQTIQTHQASAFPSGQKECVDVVLKNGSHVEVSTDHPIYTAQDWAAAVDLRPGTLVATPRHLPGPVTHLEIPDREVKLIAYMMADGCTTQENSIFSQLEGPVLQEMRTLADTRWKERCNYSICGVRPLWRKWGIAGCSAKTKRVPAQFFGMSQRQIALFINRFWACDGYFTKDGPEIVLANKALIEDLQTLLLRLGILSTSSYKLSKCDGKEFDAWRLRVNHQPSIQQWKETVGEVLGKEGRLPNPRTFNTNTDIVPIKVDEWNEILDEMGPRQRSRWLKSTPLRQRIRDAGYRGRSYAYMSRAKFQVFCAEFGYTGKYAHLASNDILWVPVQSVTPTGMHDVYDLEVPATGNFVANNIIVHNTTISVIIMIWRSLQDVNAMGVVTAPTMRQVKDVWLAEARRRMQDAHPLLKMFIKVSKSRVMFGGKDHPDWCITTFASSTAQQTQGMHEKRMTVLQEEASGIPTDIDEQMKGTVTNRDSLLIKIGNPNERDTHFFDAFNSLRHMYHVFTMNAEESSIVDPENIRKIAEEYGVDSDVYRVRVLGEFPYQNPNTVLSSDDLEACSKLNPLKWASKGGMIRQFGIDFARFGGDENALYQRCGLAILDHKTWSREEPIVPIRQAMRMEKICGWEGDPNVLWVVDADGMGQGILHVLYEAGKNVHEFHSNGVPFDDQYANQITEAFFTAREIIRCREFAIPKDNLLIKQLATRQYTLNKKGQLIVESKAEYVKRLGEEEGGGSSPDRGDAFIMALYRSAIIEGRVGRQSRRGKRVGQNTQR